MQSLIDNLRRRFPNVELLEAFGSVFDPKTLMSLPRNSPIENLHAFGLPGLQYLFDFYSRNRPVEDNQQRSVISKDFGRLRRDYQHFVGIVFEGLLPHITAESSMSEILEAYLNETNGFRDDSCIATYEPS
jgi:hypothetical protein